MQGNRFITFEGIDGAGKSTNLHAAAQHLREGGAEVLVTREPGGTAIAEEIRSLLLAQSPETLDSCAELLLMFAARAQHLAQVIRPTLARGTWVLCDRFTDATFAYQGAGRELPQRWINDLAAMVHGDLQPGLTLFYDLPTAAAAERQRERAGKRDRIEREDPAFFERVRNAYLERARAEPLRLRIIDASADPDAVRAATCAVLDVYARA